ncbi:cob(I)yrinic acid a,c-diamide adenosyltransferase [Halalkalibacter hemicellulosilyticus]|uniref:Corrinoid adenosyltransferase n=1 Tax=Halalkalibacter hemicellulosilyticusJCM 9152 TaxID=1236971 RepID=W4QC80_9BACI|nr:cob(I)yrinic acid a,c-diamide adenosyltransferase [Halalkalibacter hemicellulosilyticus]GAE28969.1 cob(I)alamin adenosyltransferase PduO [Halalkalibacter hemicellulosilyticusJCM 9152]
MKLYTRTGDEGKTSVIGGRLMKSHIRVEAYGTIDELNAFVGQAVTQLQDDLFRDIKGELERIQHELFDCGGDLAAVKKSDKIPYKTNQTMIDYLEQRMDIYIDEAPSIERFILPGGAEAAATLHICRTIARRAERQVVQLLETNEAYNLYVLKYLNRLSDYLFAIARVVNARLKIKDIEYIRSAAVFKNGIRKEEK